MKTALEVVTKENVIEFSEYLKKKYNCSIVQKANQYEMQAIAGLLDVMGIQNHDQFLQDFTTTIGRRIYVNFVIGAGNKAQLVKQIETLCHECQHVVQFDRDGAKFFFDYLRSDAARASYEVDGYRVTMEMSYYLTGKVPSVKSIIQSFEGYSIVYPDTYVAEKSLKSIYAVTAKGAVYSGVSKDSIKWWNKKRKA